MLTKKELLEPLARLRGDAVVVTCMSVVRPWGKYSASDLDLASADSAMGHTADFALGIAIAQPRRKVICLNGDGSMLMTLGTLATAVQAGAHNYTLIVVQNETYEITGNQPVPGGHRLEFELLARGAGFGSVFGFDEAESYENALPSVLAAGGPVCVVVKVQSGSEGPISFSPHEEAHYLKTSLADTAWRLRQTLSASTKP